MGNTANEKARWAIYTSVSRNYDAMSPPLLAPAGLRYIAFLDRPIRQVEGWETRSFPPAVSGYRPNMMNRYCKLFPHEILVDFDYSIYLDGNIRVIGDLSTLMNEFRKSGCALGLFRHLQRRDLAEEIDACSRLGKFKENEKELSKKQLRIYYGEGLPPNQPLTDNGILFRWHRHPELSAAMRLWWEQLQSFSGRDQLSLPYVVWKTGVPMKTWGWSFRADNSFFEVYPHRGFLFRDFLIFLFLHKESNWLANLANRFLYGTKKVYRQLRKN